MLIDEPNWSKGQGHQNLGDAKIRNRRPLLCEVHQKPMTVARFETLLSGICEPLFYEIFRR